MAYDPAQARAEGVRRPSEDRARVLGNLRGWQKQVAASGRPVSELLAEGMRAAMDEIKRLDAELEREGGYVARRTGLQVRHWPRSYDLAWQRHLGESRIATWEAELAAGRRTMTPALAEALAADRALIEGIDQELERQEAPGLDPAGGLRWAVATVSAVVAPILTVVAAGSRCPPQRARTPSPCSCPARRCCAGASLAVPYR